MNDSLETYRVAARTTPALVGREAVLQQIQTAIESRMDSIVFYITGDGGIGKTRLLTEILRLCREGNWKAQSGNLLAAEAPVDLYHTQTHALEGLVRAMGAVVGPHIQDRFFKTYVDELEALERIKPDLRFALREITERRERMTRAFVEGFRQMASSHRVVMAFDTAEMLLYEIDAVQRALRLGVEGVGVRRWLIEQLLPQVPNTVFLLAGRPKPQLLQDLHDSLAERLQVLELGPFSEKETIEYFTQVAAAARVDNEADVAQRIENIQEESRRVIHLLTEGRPILLSLVMDLLALAQRLPDEIKIPWTQAQKLGKADLAIIRAKLESSIIRQFQEVGSPGDEGIRSLAFARKGMDPILLAHVAGMSEEEAKQVLGALTGLRFNGEGKWPEPIKGLRPLSFIKVRPADRRVFLHDEMYALMERHVIRRLPEADVKRAREAILAYYDKELEKTRGEIKELQPAIREEVTPDLHIMTVPRPSMPRELLEKRAKAETYRDYLLAEQVHYMLHYKPLEGFQTYCRHHGGAFEATDDALDMQLRDELLAFIQAPERRDLTMIDGLRRAEVDLETGIKWIQRNIIANQSDNALVIADRLRKECSDLLAQVGEVGEARLSVWEGLAEAYRGTDLDRGEQLLSHAITVLHSIRPEDKFRQWQKDLELANAYNSLGYLLVRRGRHRQAIEAYKNALSLWRQLGKDYEPMHANTLNNMSWALAELGDFDDAVRRCIDGLGMRLEQGARYPIALSYNTLGQIQIRNDQPHRARTNCERALAIFRELETMRGVGMASIALAEAHRRMGAVEGVYFPEEQAEKMRQAAQYARDAVAIFGPYQSWPDEERNKPLVSEPPRLVDALIELGCAYRDWVRVRLYERQDPQHKELVQLGERALKEAAQVASEQQPHRAVDAMVNLAWLKYYIDDLQGVETVLTDIQGMIKKDYLIRETGLPTGEPEQPWHWVQLGKMHLLKGHIAFNRYFQMYAKYKELSQSIEGTDAKDLLARAHAALKESAEMYMLSLEYDNLYGQGQRFRDLKRGEARIYDRYKGLNVDELQIVMQGIQDTALKYQLEKTHLAALIDKWFGLEPDSV